MAYLTNDEYETLKALAMRSLWYENSDRKPQFGDRISAIDSDDLDGNTFREGEFFQLDMSFRWDDWWDVVVFVESDDGRDYACDATGINLVRVAEKGCK